MRKKLFLAVFAIIAMLPNTGCLFLNRYDSDPNVRMAQLLNDSENLRQVRVEKARFWGTNHPSCLSYERLHGAIGP